MRIGPLFFLYGTAVHLWYLPFIFMVTVGCAYLKGAVVRDDSKRQITFVLGAIIAFVAAILITATFNDWRAWPVPLPQWITSLPAVLLGAVWAVMLRQDRPLSLKKSLLLLSLAGALALFSFAFLGGWDVASYSCVGLGIVVLAGMWRGRESPKWLMFIASITMGVYVIHPLFISAVRCCLTPEWHAGIVHALLAIVCSVLVASLLVKTPLKAVV